MAASPRFADLDDDGVEELVMAEEDGFVHVFNGDLTEVEGWPVHVTPLELHTGSRAFASGEVSAEVYASIEIGRAHV